MISCDFGEFRKQELGGAPPRSEKLLPISVTLKIYSLSVLCTLSSTLSKSLIQFDFIYA